MHKEYILMGGMALGEHWIQFTHLVHHIIVQPGSTHSSLPRLAIPLVHHIIVQPGSTHKAMVSEGGDSIGFSH